MLTVLAINHCIKPWRCRAYLGSYYDPESRRIEEYLCLQAEADDTPAVPWRPWSEIELLDLALFQVAWAQFCAEEASVGISVPAAWLPHGQLAQALREREAQFRARRARLLPPHDALNAPA